jgi:hypothetical protein
MKTYYEYLIQEKDEVIKQLDKLLAATNRRNRVTLRSMLTAFSAQENHAS